MASGNPMLSEQTFRGLAKTGSPNEVMTVEGTANKTLLMLALLVIAAGITWNQHYAGQATQGLMMIGLFGGLGLALTTMFKRDWAKITAPAYAVCQGLFLGALSAIFEQQYPGLVMQAVAATFGTMGVMLIAYRTGTIRASGRMRRIVVGATMGIMLVYLASWIMGMFGAQMPLIHDASPIGILFSVVVAGVAAFNLILDFDMIEQGANAGAPKAMEWFGAFALMVTLIWLYLEMLRMISKIRDYAR